MEALAKGRGVEMGAEQGDGGGQEGYVGTGGQEQRPVPPGEAGLPGTRGEGRGGETEGGGEAGGEKERQGPGLQPGTSVQRTEQIGMGFCPIIF